MEVTKYGENVKKTTTSPIEGGMEAMVFQRSSVQASIGSDSTCCMHGVAVQYIDLDK
jgi:hypothetical protein